MAVYLKPRRGKKVTAINQGIILKRGEIFFEVPDTGVGTGIGKIKIGDGSTTYKDLPYFINPEDLIEDVDDTPIIFSTSTLTDINELLDTIISGAKLKNIIGSIKKVLSVFSGNISDINDTLEVKANDNEVVKLTSYNNTIGTAAISAWYPNSAFGKVRIVDNVIFALNETTTQLTDRVITLNSNIKDINTNLVGIGDSIKSLNATTNTQDEYIANINQDIKELEAGLHHTQDQMDVRFSTLDSELVTQIRESNIYAEGLYTDNQKRMTDMYNELNDRLVALGKKVASYHNS